MARFNAVDVVLWALRIGVVLVVVVGTVGTLIKDRYNAAQWFDFVMFGLTIGSIYAQIALGYTMVYGVLRLINFAHGDIVMTGAFAGYFVATPLDRSGFLESHPVLAMARDPRRGDRRLDLDRGADRAHRLPAVPPRRGAGAADLRHRRIVLPRADVPRHVRLGGEVLSRRRNGNASTFHVFGFNVPRIDVLVIGLALVFMAGST